MFASIFMVELSLRLYKDEVSPANAWPAGMLLNAFDVDPGADERTLELQAGELNDLGLRADLLVVSARQNNYEPLPGTLIHSLEQQFGICAGVLPRALDLSRSSIGAWVSDDNQVDAKRPSTRLSSDNWACCAGLGDCNLCLQRKWTSSNILFAGQ